MNECLKFLPWLVFLSVMMISYVLIKILQAFSQQWRGKLFSEFQGLLHGNSNWFALSVLFYCTRKWTGACWFQGPTQLIDLKQEQQLNMDLTSNEINPTSWPFFVFLGGSMFCLLSSSICHLFYCHSKHLNLLLLQMDYVGIAVMIITSFFPPIYYIFQCSPHWQLAYLIGITAMGVCIVITLLTPAFSTGKYRSFRAVLFMSMGFFGLIPAVHALVVNWNDPHRNLILGYESAMAVSYLTGTMFYVSRIPERWKPGWFDLTGHSHQIFHVFVIMGALAHYGAAKIFLDYRGKLGCQWRTWSFHIGYTLVE